MKFDTDFACGLPTLRFSSFFAVAKDNEAITLKMLSPYTDTYSITLTENIELLSVYDSFGKCIAESDKDLEICLNCEQTVYVYIKTERSGKARFDVQAVNHKSVLPYDPLPLPSLSSYDVNGNGEDPLIPAFIEYIKRNNGLYVNCNNPECLTEHDLNKALTRQNVSDKEVFATFEHNNQIVGDFYYGYMVRNTGTTDIFVTVKNIGFQEGGAGTWLGEKEWVEFYNTEFRIKGVESYTPEQKATYNAYYGFCNSYPSKNYAPITYRIPQGKYFYVMGGTTEDSFAGINVFSTADITINKNQTGCSNGAVLFSVVGGNAEGALFVYNDIGKIKNDTVSHQGYVVYKNGDESKSFGSQYVGYDNCNGVIDSAATWYFNDQTPECDLPVTFKNYYCDGVSVKGEPYSEIKVTEHTQSLTTWVTHINVQENHDAVGTDMTKYYTVDKNGNNIVIDDCHYDGLGNLSNIGNWMADYIDSFTFINQGDKERTVTVKMRHNGALAVMVRDEKGDVVGDTVKYAVRISKNEYGDAIEDNFSYTKVIPSHSAVRFFVEYNLLANSCGHISHTVRLA